MICAKFQKHWHMMIAILGTRCNGAKAVTVGMKRWWREKIWVT